LGEKHFKPYLHEPVKGGPEDLQESPLTFILPQALLPFLDGSLFDLQPFVDLCAK